MADLEIFEEFRFEAAHRLPLVPSGHKCARLHGHSYRVVIHVRGAVDASLGWVFDFADLTAAFAPLVCQLDHSVLNDIPGLENPTSETLACWLWERLVPQLAGLTKVVVWETDTCGCVYRGEGSPTP